MTNEIAALALITPGGTTVYYREIKNNYDRLLFELAEAVCNYTADFHMNHGVPSEARMYECDSMEDLREIIRHDCPGAAMHPMQEYNEDYARKLLERISSKGAGYFEWLV